MLASMAQRISSPGRLQMVVAANVKQRRLGLGLSQEQLAEVCGYHRTYVGSVERGERNITLSTLQALSAALQTQPQELLQERNG